MNATGTTWPDDFPRASCWKVSSRRSIATVRRTSLRWVRSSTPTSIGCCCGRFALSVTYENLKHAGEGVFHVTDDVELLARAAVGRLEDLPAAAPCRSE